MRFKLDENLGESTATIFRLASHDAETVVNEQLVGCEDVRLIEVCRKEARCLVTMDKEFGNPLVYPPQEYGGIVLVRLPVRSGRYELAEAVHRLLEAVEAMTPPSDLGGRLLIAQPDRVREYRLDAE